MKIVVILVFTLLYAYCTEASVCFCWSERVISSKKAEIGEVEHAKYASSFCCNSNIKDGFSLGNRVENPAFPACDPNGDSSKGTFKKCCSEMWGLEGKCS